jgi:hypothetical protein
MDMGCRETMISAGLLLISFMLMVLNIYLDHGYEDEDKHHADAIYIFYSLVLEHCVQHEDHGWKRKYYGDGQERRKVRLIEGNAKCRHLKN